MAACEEGIADTWPSTWGPAMSRPALHQCVEDMNRDACGRGDDLYGRARIGSRPQSRTGWLDSCRTARGRTAGAFYDTGETAPRPCCHGPKMKVADLCAELGVTRQTRYRFVGAKGELLVDRENSSPVISVMWGRELRAFYGEPLPLPESRHRRRTRCRSQCTGEFDLSRDRSVQKFPCLCLPAIVETRDGS